MRFSVIVPVYNVEKYLKKCVNSILSQNYTDFELILVDDGSPDNCPAICDEYSKKDDRVVVIHKKNGGLSDARNVGIMKAKGEYVLFIDSDDFWTETTVLEKIASVIDKDNPTIVQFGHEMYFQNEDKLIEGAPRNLEIYNGKNIEEVFWNLVSVGELAISACSMVINRSFLIENELYFVKGLKTEDLEWAIRMFVCEPVLYSIDEYFYGYRKQREDSISATVDYKHLCDYCWIIENSLKRVENCNQKLKEALMSYLMYHILIASALCYRAELNKNQRKEILSKLKGFAKGRITKHTLDKKVRLASIVYRFGGFYVMSKVLGFYLNNRGR